MVEGGSAAAQCHVPQCWRGYVVIVERRPVAQREGAARGNQRGCAASRVVRQPGRRQRPYPALCLFLFSWQNVPKADRQVEFTRVKEVCAA